MKTYNVWVTLMTGGAADSIVAGLVRKGFGLSALDIAKNLYEGTDDSASRIMAINLSFEIEKLSPEEAKLWVHKVVQDVIEESGMMYYSLVVVSPDSGSRWSAGNIKLPNCESLAQGPYR